MTLTVFCGANAGKNPIYEKEAIIFAKTLAKYKCSLVYGGGGIGIMGIISRVAKENGAHVTGVIPHALQEKEKANHENSELILVENMHERKFIMENMADAFVVLPGGIGTLEEIFEVWTWAQLGYHDKPFVFLDINGFYKKLFEFLDDVEEEGFLKKTHRNMVKIFTNSDELISTLVKNHNSKK